MNDFYARVREKDERDRQLKEAINVWVRLPDELRTPEVRYVDRYVDRPAPAISADDQQLILETIRQRDLYMAMVHDLEAQAATDRDRIAQLESQRSILCARCFHQAKAIERMQSRQVNLPDADDTHPAIRAVEAMQKQGIR